MKKIGFLSILLIAGIISHAQVMTPELLWSLERVSPIGITKDGNLVAFRSTTYDINENESQSSVYLVDINGGPERLDEDYEALIQDASVSPDGKFKLTAKKVKLKQVFGVDHHPDMEKSNVFIYDQLNYRHWDSWEDGEYSHLFLEPLDMQATGPVDIMEGLPYDTPTEPFGGSEDYTWNHDGSKVLYVTKPADGTEYAQSTNTDVFEYDVASGETQNLTPNNKGYDTSPSSSSKGTYAWLQMDEPGYESDKNDLIIYRNKRPINLTRHWDGTVLSYHWSNDERLIYFIAPIEGTRQLFSVSTAGPNQDIKQLTSGQFDITGIVGIAGNKMVVTKTDMNHATEIYTLNLSSNQLKQLTHRNDNAYASITLSKVEKRIIKTTDGQDMLTWVIYPPNFDPNKSYPTLLYCQGGPQSALTQFYSFRWNFQLMAAQGYVVVAPNRRGMPGHGVKWNEQISGDWGGQNMDDYLSAIDDLMTEPYVDRNRVGCVGASYGGYSAFYLAGNHKGRFKSFIAHDGVFNTRSMYGTTEELFFVNKDLDGPYWEYPHNKSYNEFNPINHVNKWDTPIMIIQGGKDYRVPVGQGLEAFQAAQLKGLKSKLLYFPDENHWILSAQNAIIWQREFFTWLDQTLNVVQP